MKQLYNEKIFTTLLGQHITEKSTFLEAKGIYIFRVKCSEDKIAVKKAVEAIFNVTVKAVRICNMRGKAKGRLGKTKKSSRKRNNWKKAYVMLKEGQIINFT